VILHIANPILKNWDTIFQLENPILKNWDAIRQLKSYLHILRYYRRFLPAGAINRDGSNK
jgi:hypothetical protein